MSIYFGLTVMYYVANNKNCVIIMFVYFNLFDLKEHIWKKNILKLRKFTLILCITENDWNYVRIIIVNVNLLNFGKTIGKKYWNSVY